MTDDDTNYNNDIDDDIAHSKEDETRIILAEARATLTRLETKSAATVITRAVAMTIKPEPDETYSAWLDRCIPSAMQGDPSLTRDRAADQCSIIFEENQVPGVPGGLHSYQGKPKGAYYERELQREVQKKLAVLERKVTQQTEPIVAEPPKPQLLTPTQMQQVFAYFEQRLAEAIAEERGLMYEDVGKALGEWVQPKLNDLREEILKFVRAEYKRSDTVLLANQINLLKNTLRDEIRKLNPTSKQPESAPPAVPGEPIDLPNPLMHKPIKQLN
jgi:hypothetical protein